MVLPAMGKSFLFLLQFRLSIYFFNSMFFNSIYLLNLLTKIGCAQVADGVAPCNYGCMYKNWLFSYKKKSHRESFACLFVCRKLSVICTWSVLRCRCVSVSYFHRCSLVICLCAFICQTHLFPQISVSALSRKCPCHPQSEHLVVLSSSHLSPCFILFVLVTQHKTIWIRAPIWQMQA